MIQFIVGFIKGALLALVVASFLLTLLVSCNNADAAGVRTAADTGMLLVV